MQLSLTRIKSMLIVSALALAGCVSNPTTPIDCHPSAPQLEWFEVADGGVYYPKRSFVNLQLYIQGLNDCIDDHQKGQPY